MLDYIIAVICAVAVSGIIMLVVFHRLKVLSFRTVASVALASLVTALIMPSIFNILSRSEAEKTDPTILIILTVAAFIAYMLIVMILSILISVIVPKTEKKVKKPAKADTGVSGAGKAEAGTRERTVLEQVGLLYFGDKAEDSTDHRQETTGADTGQQEGVSAAGMGETAASAETEPAVSTAEAEPAVSAAEAEPAAAVGEGTAISADYSGFETAGTDFGADADAGEPTGAADIETPETADAGAEEYAAGIASADPQEQSGPDREEPSAAGEQYAGDSYIEQIYLDYAAQNDEKTGLPEKDSEMTEIIEGKAEKSVDSAEIIDKMGIEKKVNDSGTITLEECIIEAFRHKEAGDPEGAILNFMYALDKKPQEELTFWIVLDICVMYKSLGQQELALEILNAIMRSMAARWMIS